MRWRRLSLRARLTLLGVVGLSGGLALGGVTLVAVLDFALHRAVADAARQTAESVAQQIDDQGVGELVAVSGVDAVVQVVDARSTVRTASFDGDRLTPMLNDAQLARVRAGQSLIIDGADLGVDGPLLVTAADAGPDDANPQRGHLTVLAARPIGGVADTVRTLRTTLLIAFPLLVAVLTAIAWRVIGATLRPVEALRRGAEEISGSGGPGQLPVPESRDEIHRLAVTLNDMLARMEAARARQRAFVADAAHELRSPLTNMRTQLEVAQRLGERTEWPAVADDLFADAERLSRLVEDLLLLARSDDPAAAEAARRAAVPVDLGELLRAAADRFPSPPVVTHAPAEPCWVLGDPDALHRVVTNLVDNAVRHARTRVVLAARAQDRHRVIAVTDDGPGIPAADRERVFDRFTRLDDARARDGGGAGLGLAIVRELARRHGGTVRLSDAGPGLRAEIHLPAPPATTPTPPPLPPPPPLLPPPPLPPPADLAVSLVNKSDWGDK